MQKYEHHKPEQPLLYQIIAPVFDPNRAIK